MPRIACDVVWYAVLVGFGLVHLSSYAEGDEIDPREFLRLLQEHCYTNLDRGITDLVVDIRDDGLSRNYPDLGSAEVVGRFYWKPERGVKVVVQDLPPAAASLSGQIAGELETQWRKYILQEPFSDEIKGYELKVESRGQSIIATATGGGQVTESGWDRVEMTFTRNLEVQRRVITLPVGGTITEEYRTTSKEGRFRIDSIQHLFRDVPGPDGKPGNFDMTVDFDYTEVDGYSFPERIAGTGMGESRVATFQNYQVNKGFEDTIYEE